MKQGFSMVTNVLTEEGLPAGGLVVGVGLSIDWQNGPLGRCGTTDRVEPNGAFVEDVIEAARQRIEHYQEASGGRFRCGENARAITKLEEALLWLDKRTQRRTEQNVEGTHEGS